MVHEIIDSILTWASTLLPSIMELCDRVESQRKAINEVSSVSRKDEINKDALYSKISELQALVHDHEQREKSLSAKISALGIYLPFIIFEMI